MLRELRENTNNLMKSEKQEQKEMFSKVIENIKKNQTKILELKNIMNELKNSIEDFNNRLDKTEEKISELKDRSFEMIRSEEQKEKKEWKRMKKVYRI